MVEFEIPLRSGVETFGKHRIVIPEVAYKPEVVTVTFSENGEYTEYVGWGGRLWRHVRGPKGRLVDPEALKASFGRWTSILPVSWENPLLDRSDAAQISRAEKWERRDLLIARLERSARRLTFMDGALHLAVEDPVYTVVLGDRSVVIDIEEPGETGTFAHGGWGTFRADRWDDAKAFAEHLAKVTRQPIKRGARGIEVRFSTCFSRNDTIEPAMIALARLAALPKKINGKMPIGLASDLQYAADLTAMRPDFSSVDVADAVYDVVSRAEVGLSNLIDEQGQDRFAVVDAHRVCGFASHRYETYDRSWLTRYLSDPLSDVPRP